MKNVNGYWLPDAESHLEPFLMRGPYQHETLKRAVSYVGNKGVCLDVGAHCGLWSMFLTKMFDHVYAFEPIPAHRECFARNVQGNYSLFHTLLGAETKESVNIVWEPGNTGHTHVGEGSLSCEMNTLDSYHLEPDFIKMDCEGYEYYVCLGGKETILKHKPILCIEQKPHGFYGISKLAAVELLCGWGADVLDKVRDDYILGWKR